MKIESIGTIHSPYTRLEDMPIQPKGAKETIGTIRLYPQYQQGLTDLEGFSHVYLIYHFHQAKRVELMVIPFMDTTPRGVFATRSPLRPNHIGLSIVELAAISGNELTVYGIDVLDGTPLLDIKPYIENFDAVQQSSSGWMKRSAKEVAQKRSDTRFIS